MAPRKKNDAAPKKDAKKKPTKAEQAATLAKSDDIERKRVTKDVPQIADAASAQKQAHELASVSLQIEKHEADLRDYAGEIRKKLRPLRKDRTRLAQAVEGNTIMRRVTVFQILDYKLNQVRYEGIGPDDQPDGKAVPGLPVEVMSDEQRQRTLFEGDGPRVAAEEEADGDEEELDEEPEDDE